jgi:hypothetical protein
MMFLEAVADRLCSIYFQQCLSTREAARLDRSVIGLSGSNATYAGLFTALSLDYRCRLSSLPLHKTLKNHA